MTATTSVTGALSVPVGLIVGSGPCDACGEVEGAFMAFGRMGVYCDCCAGSCLSCGRSVDAGEAMLCGVCRQAYELTEDVAGRLCWGAKSDAHVENAWAEHMCRALGIEDDDEPTDVRPSAWEGM